MTLDDIRDDIDRLDAQIVRLLDERARRGREAAKAKRILDLPLRDPLRERDIASRLAALSDGSMPLAALENIYRSIMSETLRLEEDGDGLCSGHNPEGKIDATAEILENIEAASGFYRMRLRAPMLAGAFRPGQFFQIRLDAATGKTFLRRPFAPSEMTEDGLAFMYAVVGEGTRLMTTLPLGTRLRVLAPLGNAYTIPPAGGTALVMGGGCGGPSLAPLARRLRAEGVKTTVVLGAKTASAVLEHSLFAKAADRVIVATDDGSRGCRGTVVDASRLEGLIDPVPTRMYACGPRAMLKAISLLAEETGAPCEVSLEERMACGFGACMGCAVAVRDEKAAGCFVYRRVCHEGPVFDSRTLVW